MRRDPFVGRLYYHFWICVAGVLLCSNATADVLVQYDLDGTGVPTVTAPHVLPGDFFAEPGVDEGTGHLDAGISTLTFMAYVRSEAVGVRLVDDDYLGFRVDVVPGRLLSLQSLEFDFGGSSNANPYNVFVNSVHIQSSVDGINVPLRPGDDPQPIHPILATFSETTTVTEPELDTQAVVDLSHPRFQGLTSIEFRFTFSQELYESGHVHRVDNVVLRGTTVPEPSTLLLAMLGLSVVRHRRPVSGQGVTTCDRR